MGDEDIKLELFAEKDANPNNWDQPVTIKGECLIGCQGRKLLNTKNLLKALAWADYHREGAEHVGGLLRKRMGSGQITTTGPWENHIHAETPKEG